jgi:TMEM175 potassium channel family protein
VRTKRGFERLITFADAVVAIALTLLVLPLTEIATDLDGRRDVWEVLGDHRDSIGAFVLSFVVIWVFWTAHHRMMEFFDAYDGVILRLTLIWLFTIVALPFVTQLLAGEEYRLGAAPLYDGVLFVSSLSLGAMSWWGHRRPALLHADSEEVRRWLAEPVSLVTPAILLVALVLSIFVPAIGSWPLLALVLDDRLEHLWLRIRGKRPAAPGKAPAPRP